MKQRTLTRAAYTTPTTADEATRTVDLVIATEGGIAGQTLICNREAVSWGPAPVPVLLSHENKANAMAGRLTSIRFERGAVIGTAQFTDAPAAEAGWALARSGCAVSVGAYFRNADTAMRGTTEVVNRWRLAEASLVPIGADPLALTRAAQSINPEPKSMNTDNAQIEAIDNGEQQLSRAEANRHLAVERSAAVAKLSREETDEILATTTTTAAGLMEVVKRHAAVVESRAAGAGHPARINGWAPGADDSLTTRLVERFHGRGSLTMPEILEATTQHRGRPAELLTRAMSTSDFPELFGGAGQRYLKEIYEAADSGARMMARRRVSPDLRDIHLLGLSEFPQLVKLLEGGEITYGSFEDLGGSYRVEEYAKGISLTRRALLSDNLDAFQQALGTFGRAVALLEDSLVVTALETGGTGAKVMEDSKALFHADHVNTTTAVGLTETSLSEATKRLREQTAPGNTARLNLTPKLLMVPAAVEVTARKLVASITPHATADASPFAGGALTLEVMVDANLAGTHCYVAVQPGNPAAVLELCEGPAAVDVTTQNDFETTGIKTRVLADRGLGVRNYRGICRIPLA